MDGKGGEITAGLMTVTVTVMIRMNECIMFRTTRF